VVADFHYLYGTALYRNGATPNAREELQQAALANAELWHELPTADSYGFTAAWAYQTLALANSIDPIQANKTRANALEIYDQLIRRHRARVQQEPTNSERRQQLSTAYHGMATTLFDANRTADAIPYLQQCTAENRAIYEANRTAAHLHALRDVLRNLSRALVRSNRFEDAVTILEQRHALATNDLGEQYQVRLDAGRLLTAAQNAGYDRHADLQTKLDRLK
jgi:tetratricopeptide (TPR) repeat protein